MNMDIKAESKSEKISPRKVMIVAETLKGESAVNALNTLLLIRKRGAVILYKLLKSAVANAVNNAKKDRNILFVKSIEVTGGPFQKRFRPSTRGRVHPYKKRTSHIRVMLEEKGGKLN